MSTELSSLAGPSGLEEQLGFRIGERMTDPETVVRVLRLLAERDPRVKFMSMGRSFEGRELYYLLVTSEENHRRLDAIRGALHELSFPSRNGLTEERRDELLASVPAVVWLNYSIHGDEPSGTDAALGVVDRLISPRSQADHELLDQVIALIEPCENPDGRARFIQNHKTFFGLSAKEHPLALEHTQPWPGARGNHYFFDLNRDWFLLTQPESRSRVAAFFDWPGVVLADFHEMPSNLSYFFYPPSEPIHAAFGTEKRRIWAGFGQALAVDFDARRVPYFTGELFDALYPGYADTWSSLQGSVGMTLEQSSPRGLAVRRNDGSSLTYSEAVQNHVEASMTILRHSEANREKLWRHFFRYRAGTAEARWATEAIFLLTSGNTHRVWRLVQTLQMQGIEVRQTRKTVQFEYAYDAFELTPRRMEVPAGSFLIRTDQDSRHLIRALFEPSATSIREEQAGPGRARHRGVSGGFSDRTAWSLPLATGVDVVFANDGPLSFGSPVVSPPPRGESTLHQRPYSLLLPWSDNAPRVLFELLGLDLPVRVATRPIQIAGRSLGEGTFLVLAARDDEFDSKVEHLSTTARTELLSTASGMASQGPALGSDAHAHYLAPRVALAGGWPTDSASFGAVSYLFERRYHIPYVPFRVSEFAQFDWSGFNVLVFPDGDARDFQTILGPQKEVLREWLRAGGTLIGVRGSARALASEGLGLSSVQIQDELITGSSEAGESTQPGRYPNSQVGSPGKKSDGDGVAEPGVFLRLELDSDHFLGFGMDSHLTSLRRSSWLMEAAETVETPIRFSSDRELLLLSGAATANGLTSVMGKPFVTRERVGRGQVILFAEDPSYRAFFWELERLLLNAVLLGPTFLE